jgi:hypothetical protein
MLLRHLQYDVLTSRPKNDDSILFWFVHAAANAVFDAGIVFFLVLDYASSREACICDFFARFFFWDCFV